ncbi:MAG: PEP-CTERM system TPR-repeat protein PrsT [Rugosibacter sp.]|nr:PEP-CTERM system TPR-repeat protein PrsT [Rugosibacter sp.]
MAIIAATLIMMGCNSSSPEKMMASAKEYLEKDDPAAAIIQIKNVLNKDSNSPEARLLLGRALLESGDPVAAELELRKAIDLKISAGQVTPPLARALMAQGKAKKVIDELASTPTANAEELAELKTVVAQSHIMLANIESAKTTFNEALAAKPHYAPAQLGLARLEAIKGNLAEANKIVDEVLIKNPREADAWHFKGDLQRAEQKLPEALAAYQKVLEIKPSTTSVHVNIIMLQIQDKKLDLAAKQLAEMQKVAAKQPITVYLTALIAFSKKDIATAGSAVENLLKMQPDNPQGLQLAGAIAYQKQSDIQAQNFLSKALQKAPGLDYSRRLLVRSYLRSKQPTKALSTLQPVLQGATVPPAWLTLAGEVYMQNGDTERAAEFFSQAAKHDPKDSKAKTALALSQMRLGHTEQAFADLEQIAASDSGVTADMAIIASAMRQKEFDKALQAIANLEKKQPNSPLIHDLRGQVLVAKKDTPAAKKSFEKALAADPTYLSAATNLVAIDLAENKIDQARQRYEAVIAKDPKNVPAMLSLAQLKARTGASLDDVASLLKKAVAADISNPTSRFALMSFYLNAKDKDKARAATEEALATFPENPEILLVAGQVYQLSGDTNQALSTYNKLTNLVPNNPQPYLRIAEIHLAAKNRQAARDTLAKGLAKQPDALPLQRAQIMLDVTDARFSDALTTARTIQKTQPKEVAGYLLEGDIHLAQKAWKDAITAYRVGLKAAPTTDLAGRLYFALLQSGQTAEAGNSVDTWLKAHPSDQGFRTFVAEIANKRKDYATAISHYRAVLAVEPKNPAILNNLAWSLGQLNDPKALAYAEEANKLAPNQPAIMETLGTLYVAQGKPAAGAELLAKVVSLAPQNPDFRLSYAKALIKAGKKAEAKPVLETLTKLGEKFSAHAEVAELSKGL